MRLLLATLFLASPALADDDVDAKSPALAVSLSAATTAAGVGLMFTEESEGIVSGAVLVLAGPSVGHWYAHDGVNGGMGIRALGLTLTAIGMAGAGGYGNDEDTTAVAIGWTGIAVFAGGTIYEIATAARSVREYNRAQRAQRTTIVPTGRGLALVGSF